MHACICSDGICNLQGALKNGETFLERRHGVAISESSSAWHSADVNTEYSAEHDLETGIFFRHFLQCYSQWLYTLDLDCACGLTYLSQRHVFIDG